MPIKKYINTREVAKPIAQGNFSLGGSKGRRFVLTCYKASVSSATKFVAVSSSMFG